MSLSFYCFFKTSFALGGFGCTVCASLECVSVGLAPALVGGSLSPLLCPLPLSPALCFQTTGYLRGGDRLLQPAELAMSSSAPSFL